MKTRKIENVLKTLFDLNDTEIKCLRKIYSQKQVTLRELAKFMKKDISHISRCVNKLLDAGLIKREAKCCTHGKRGRYWIYKSLKKSQFKKFLRKKAHEMYKEIVRSIRKI